MYIYKWIRTSRSAGGKAESWNTTNRFRICSRQDVEGFYILRAAALKTTNSGKPFLSGTICDRTGSMEIKIWDYSGPIGARPEDTGRVVKIRGSVSEYRGALQVSVHRIRMAEAADNYDTSLLVPTAPIDTDAALTDVQRMVASITDADYRSIAETMLAQHLDAFRRSGRQERAPQFSVRPLDAYLQHAAHGGFPRWPVFGGH